MFVIMNSRSYSKLGLIGSKTRSLGQFLEKRVYSRGHSYDLIFKKLCQNVEEEKLIFYKIMAFLNLGIFPVLISTG